jgi:hypothetical protein
LTIANAAQRPGLAQALGLMQSYIALTLIAFLGASGCAGQSTKAELVQPIVITCWSKISSIVLDVSPQCAPEQDVGLAVAVCGSEKDDPILFKQCMRQRDFVRTTLSIPISAPETRRMVSCRDTRPIEDCPGQLD